MRQRPDFDYGIAEGLMIASKLIRNSKEAKLTDGLIDILADTLENTAKEAELHADAYVDSMSDFYGEE